MSDESELIHQYLVEAAEAPSDGWVIDLGCGRGPTLAAFARTYPGMRLTGIDRSVESVEAAREMLADYSGRLEVLAADLRVPAPLPDGCADAVVSYNLLECLPDADPFFAEIWRLLKPRGKAVVAHVDFDSIVIEGADRQLDRQICHAFTDDQQTWMDHADGRIGRKLPGLVKASPLALTKVRTWVTSSTEMSGQAARRIDNIRQALTNSARRGTGLVALEEVDAWYAAVQESASLGRFFFAETAVVVSASRPA
ncbi:methyltransferase domain-containing protein [Kitasatospora acidiphila]|uniref:methyltransferase domain-containing protein n=1 Tax=Kitasatospora acidiphila TaxID=2567942 RepID=UPI0015F02673|nr:methyltransferase domain-containing protein [Kitasatospora acidiphila]